MQVYRCCWKVRIKETNYIYLDGDVTWVNQPQEEEEEGNETVIDQTEAFISQDLVLRSQLYISWKNRYLSKLQEKINKTLSQGWRKNICN